MAWSPESINMLITGYKQRPYLYDSKSPEYFIRYKRKQGEEEIASIVSAIRPGTTGTDVKRKIQILRTTYSSERAKTRVKSSKMGSSQFYISSWAYYRALSFLDRHLKMKKFLNNSPSCSKTNNNFFYENSVLAPFSEETGENPTFEVVSVKMEDSETTKSYLLEQPQTTFDTPSEKSVELEKIEETELEQNQSTPLQRKKRRNSSEFVDILGNISKTIANIANMPNPSKTSYTPDIISQGDQYCYHLNEAKKHDIEMYHRLKNAVNAVIDSFEVQRLRGD